MAPPPPILPMGVATQLPGRYLLPPTISSSGSGDGLDLSERTSTSSASGSPAAVETDSSSGWTPRAGFTLHSKVSGSPVIQEAQLFAGIWPTVLPIADDLCKCCGAFI